MPVSHHGRPEHHTSSSLSSLIGGQATWPLHLHVSATDIQKAACEGRDIRFLQAYEGTCQREEEVADEHAILF